MINKLTTGIMITLMTINIGSTNLNTKELNNTTEKETLYKIENIENEVLNKTNVIITKDNNYIENNYEVVDAVGVATILENEYEIVIETTGVDEFDKDTYYHELGHAIDFEYNLNWDMTSDMLSEAVNLFKDDVSMLEYVENNSVEYFAASYALFRTYPELVKDEAPITYDFILSISEL